MASDNDKATYDRTARGYLFHARKCLLRPEPAYLFYGALELRLCIEARQNRYVQAQQRYLASIPAAHKIGHQAAALRRLFKRDDILRITIEFFDIPPIILHYTPVSDNLKKSAEKLGDLLHIRGGEYDEAWWSETHDRLVKTYREAWVICQGELLSPLIMDRRNEVVGAMEFAGPPNSNLMKRILEPGRPFKLTVAYIDSLPAQFVSDL